MVPSTNGTRRTRELPSPLEWSTCSSPHPATWICFRRATTPTLSVSYLASAQARAGAFQITRSMSIYSVLRAACPLRPLWRTDYRAPKKSIKGKTRFCAFIQHCKDFGLFRFFRGVKNLETMKPYRK